MRLHSVVAAATIAACALPSLASAQAASTEPLRIGVLAGFNSATIGGDDADDAKRRSGVLGGLSLFAPIRNGWGFRPELLYSQKGAKASIDEAEGFAGSATVKLDYIDIPLLLQYEASTSSGIRPQLYLGPSIGLKARCNVEGAAGGVKVSTTCDEAETDVKSTDIAGIVGGALAFPVGNRFFTVGARYQHGLTDIAEDANVRNRVFSVYAGFEFSLKR
jgi:hypothetical protein